MQHICTGATHLKVWHRQRGEYGFNTWALASDYNGDDNQDKALSSGNQNKHRHFSSKVYLFLCEMEKGLKDIFGYLSSSYLKSPLITCQVKKKIHYETVWTRTMLTPLKISADLCPSYNLHSLITNSTFPPALIIENRMKLSQSLLIAQ